MSNSNLPMSAFQKNASFIGFDASMWLKDQPLRANSVLRKLIDMFVTKRLHPPQPLHVYNISEVESVFDDIQSGRMFGKAVLEITSGSRVPVRPCKSFLTHGKLTLPLLRPYWRPNQGFDSTQMQPMLLLAGSEV